MIGGVAPSQKYPAQEAEGKSGNVFSWPIEIPAKEYNQPSLECSDHPEHNNVSSD